MFDEQISCCTGDHHLSWLAPHTQTVASYVHIHRPFLPFQKPKSTFHGQYDGNFSTLQSLSFFLWVKNGKSSCVMLVLSRMCEVFLISNFCHVLYVVCFLLGISLASEFYMSTFQKTLSVPSS